MRTKGKNKIIKGKLTWKKMDGDIDLEKKINHYLTERFITSSGVPSDECLTEAKYIVSLFLDEFEKALKRHKFNEIIKIERKKEKNDKIP